MLAYFAFSRSVNIFPYLLQVLLPPLTLPHLYNVSRVLLEPTTQELVTAVCRLLQAAAGYANGSLEGIYIGRFTIDRSSLPSLVSEIEQLVSLTVVRILLRLSNFHDKLMTDTNLGPRKQKTNVRTSRLAFHCCFNGSLGHFLESIQQV